MININSAWFGVLVGMMLVSVMILVWWMYGKCIEIFNNIQESEKSKIKLNDESMRKQE